MLCQQTFSEKARRFVLIWALFCTFSAPSTSSPEISKLVDLVLMNEAGEMVRLADLTADRPTLLYFWATWCKPCRAIQKKVSRYARENKGRVQVLAINVGGVDSWDDIKRYRHRYRIRYTLLLDRDNKAIEAYNINGIPAFILLRASGEILYRGNVPPANLDDPKLISHRGSACWSLASS